VQGGVNLGPYAVSTELGAARNYQTSTSSVYGSPPGFNVAGEVAPDIHAAVSIGGQITLYRSVH
jgi:hypothetical protein